MAVCCAAGFLRQVVEVVCGVNFATAVDHRGNLVAGLAAYLGRHPFDGVDLRQQACDPFLALAFDAIVDLLLGGLHRIFQRHQCGGDPLCLGVDDLACLDVRRLFTLASGFQAGAQCGQFLDTGLDELVAIGGIGVRQRRVLLAKFCQGGVGCVVLGDLDGTVFQVNIFQDGHGVIPRGW